MATSEIETDNFSKIDIFWLKIINVYTQIYAINKATWTKGSNSLKTLIDRGGFIGDEKIAKADKPFIASNSWELFEKVKPNRFTFFQTSNTQWKLLSPSLAQVAKKRPHKTLDCIVCFDFNSTKSYLYYDPDCDETNVVAPASIASLNPAAFANDAQLHFHISASTTIGADESIAATSNSFNTALKKALSIRSPLSDHLMEPWQQISSDVF